MSSAKPTCSIDGCDGVVRARGWCGKHWQRWRKHGDPLFALVDRTPLQPGARFGRLVVIGHGDGRASDGGRIYRCQCDCGALMSVAGQHLTRGASSSCGCLSAEVTAMRTRVHGHAGTDRSRTYRSWLAMNERCSNPNHHAWGNYGGRGITICERWRSFENFLADMGERPQRLSLDRIDVNGNYEPGNCRWATRSEQARNTRRAAR